MASADNTSTERGLCISGETNIVRGCGDGTPSEGACRTAGLANCQRQLVQMQLDVGVRLECRSVLPSTMRNRAQLVPLAFPVRDKRVVQRIGNIGTYRYELSNKLRNLCGEFGKGNLFGRCTPV